MKMFGKMALRRIAAPWISAAAAAVMAASLSCSKDDTVIFNDVTMGTLSGNAEILTDGGNIYNIVDGKTVEGIDPGTRVFVTCDILGRDGEAADRYNVRLNSVEVPVSGLTVESADADLSGWTDAISVSDAWISAGYLNLYCVWIGRRDSSAEHGIMLVHDSAAADTVRFSLVHDAKGEGFYEDTAVPSDLKTIYKTATFPVGKYISGENVTVKLSWTWHKTGGQYIYPETEPFSIVYDLTRPASPPALPTKDQQGL